MSRILKRPMFRKGGEVMEGIMTGIKPRTNLANAGFLPEINPEIGGSSDRKMEQDYVELMNSPNNPSTTPNMPTNMSVEDRYREIYSGMAPSKDEILTKLLISGGLRGMSQTGGGGTLGNLAKAFQEPTDQALSELFASKRSEQQAKLKGLEFDIAKQLKAKTGKDGYESGSYYGRQKTLLDFYSKEPGFDANEAFVLVQQLMSLQDKGIGTSFKQVMQDASGNPLTDEQIENKNPPVGSVFYDKELRVMKQIDENGNLVLLDTVKESTGE